MSSSEVETLAWYGDRIIELERQLAEARKDSELLRLEMDGLNKRNDQLFNERNEATELLVAAQQMLQVIAARQKEGK